jgi:hypothetical protein
VTRGVVCAKDTMWTDIDVLQDLNRLCCIWKEPNGSAEIVFESDQRQTVTDALLKIDNLLQTYDQ